MDLGRHSSIMMLRWIIRFNILIIIVNALNVTEPSLKSEAFPLFDSQSVRILEPEVRMPVSICRENITKDEVIARYLPSCASCKGRCGGVTTMGVFRQDGCSCDSGCRSYMDCSPDFETHCSEEALQPVSIAVARPATCRTLWGLSVATENYLLIDSCLKNESACRISSESASTMVPVWDSETQLHFVNLNCAVCNGVKDIIPWDSTMVCKKSQVSYRRNISETLTKDEFEDVWDLCSVDLTPNLNKMKQPRTCVPQFVIPKSSCDQICVGTEIGNLCKTGHTTYLSHNVEWHSFGFSNFFCVLCAPRGNLVRDDMNCKINFPGFIVRPLTPEYFSFRLLFDVDLRHGLTVGQDPLPQCPEEQIWVEDEQRCRFNYLDTNVYNRTTDKIVIVMSIENGTLTHHVLVSVDRLTLQLSPYIQRNEIFMLDNITLAISVFTTNSTSFTREKFLNQTRTWFPYISWKLLYFKNTETLFNCEHDTPVYNKTEFSFMEGNQLRLHTNPNQVIPEERFKIINNLSVVVCSIPDSWEGYGPKSLNAMSIVTIVCVSLSIISHVIRLILHCVLSEGGPARLQVCLVVSLLIGMVSFLLNPLVTHPFPLCYSTAVVIHWSFLAAFCWMTVIGWDILYMFKATSNLQRIGKGDKRFIIYSAYAWGLPSLIVTSAIVIDHSDVDSMWQPAYGVTLCWISGRIGLLLYFVSPVALQVLINIIAFICCSVFLFKNKTMDRRKREKERFWLHIRLFFLMGITWVTGFLAIPLNSDALWYVFIVLSASQGVYLLLVYVLTKRNRHKFQEISFSHLRSKNTSDTDTTSADLTKSNRL